VRQKFKYSEFFLVLAPKACFYAGSEDINPGSEHLSKAPKEENRFIKSGHGARVKFEMPERAERRHGRRKELRTQGPPGIRNGAAEA